MHGQKEHFIKFEATNDVEDFFSMLERKRGFLTVEQLAEQLQVSSRSIYRLVSKGRIPHLRIGKQIRLEAVTLAKWLRERRETKKL